MTDPLLSTKLHIPQPRLDFIPRPRLIEKLNSGLSRALTLLSAPAGYGKSTLLSTWVDQTELRARVAWLSLDEDDNELIRFLTYFIAALQSIETGIGKGILVALQAPGAVNIDAVLTNLLNEIAKLPFDVVLILEDYHTIEAQPIDQVISFVIEHLPAQMHLVIASRIDPSLPITRLRARTQMIEIRADDLRFTLDEAAAYLTQALGFDLPTEDVAALVTRTEGWITGLQLAALSIQGSDDVRGFVRSFTGSNRYILDYLGEEVLSHQTQAVQDFLLQTSILKQLSGSLCDAITGKNNGEEMLVSLERGNLFIIPLDNERRWYRYHHLFRDMLYRRLSQVYPEMSTELHQRASIWYQQAGDIDAAFHHLLASGNPENAADILEDHWQEFFIRGEFSKLKRMLDSLGQEITNTSAPLRMAFCMIYSQTGAVELIPNHIESIRRIITELTRSDYGLKGNLAAIPSLVEAMEAVVALDNGLASKAKDHALKAISLIPDDSNPVERRRLHLSANFRLGQAHRELGELDQACSILLEVLEMLKATESYYVVNTALQVVSIYQETGRKQEALALCEDTLRFIAEKQWEELPPVGQVYIALAGLQADAGDYEAAQSNLDIGWGLVEQRITPEINNVATSVREKLENVPLHHQPLIEPLSERELEVLQLIAQGLSNREISERLFLALSTVKGHNRNIFDKLQVKRRTEAVARARELGLM